MPYVAIVTVLALLEFFWFGWSGGTCTRQVRHCGTCNQRQRDVRAHFRVHMNTLEQLRDVPARTVDLRHFVSPLWAAALGVVFIIGRAIYANAYVRDPKSRSTRIRADGVADAGADDRHSDLGGSRADGRARPHDVGPRVRLPAAGAARGPAACADPPGSSVPSDTDDPRGSCAMPTLTLARIRRFATDTVPA